MEEWKEYNFNDITINYDKNRIPLSSKERETRKGEYRYFGAQGVIDYVDDYIFDGQYILLAEDGENLKSKKQSLVQFVSGKFWVNNHAHILTGNEKCDIKFLFYLLDSIDFTPFITGSAQPKLSQQSLSKIYLKLPPLPTQQKIAAILSSLDDKIELNNKINTNLEQQAVALFKNWFVDKYEKEGTIGDYCSVKSGFAFKSSWWQDEGTKVIRIGDIEQGSLNLETCAHVANDKIEVAKDFIVQGGDLVIAMTGATIGKFSMIPKTQEPILVNQRVGKFFLGNNPIERVPFIYCTLKQEEVITEFINRGQGSAQPNISTGDILSIPCWIPNEIEIDNFNKTIQPMFETIISNQEENRKLSVLRDSLLPKLMSGEIEVGI